MTGHCGRMILGTGWRRRPCCAEVEMKDEGGYFVVMTDDGRYWSRDGPVERWRDAERFAFPLADPWLACRRACDDVARRLGVGAAPCYVPPAKVGLGQ